MTTYKKISIDLLRHGHCDDGKIYRGSTNSPLSKVGWQQMNAVLAQTNLSTVWQRVICSPLIRCQAFAETVSSKLALPLISMPEFQEYHFGDWEGQLIDVIWQTQPELAQQFYDDPDNITPPNAESMQAFLERLMQGLTTLSQQYDQQHVLLITHAGVIRALICHLLSIPLNKQMSLHIPYAGISRLHYYVDSQQVVLEFLNYSCSSSALME